MCKIVSENLNSGVTILPNRFIDEFMVDADECALKVYIYLLRFIFNPGVDVDVKAMADALDITVTKTKKALKSWQAKGLLNVVEDEKGNISQVRLLDINSVGTASAYAAAPVAKPAKAEAKTEEVEEVFDIHPELIKRDTSNVIFPKYSAAQMKVFGDDGHFAELIEKMQRIVIEKSGKMVEFKAEDIKTLAGIYECLEFSDELIEYLYTYCAERGNTSYKYIKAVAMAWAEDGIKSAKDADYQTKRYSQLLNNMKKALGKHSGFGEQVIKEIESWVYDFGMDDEVIIYACNKAASRGTDTPFPIVRKMINDWHEKNVKTLKDAEACSKEHEEATKSRARRSATTSTFNAHEQREDCGSIIADFDIGDSSEKVDIEALKERLAKH